MMFTADQLVAHLVGDYILQSHWMAVEKTKNSVAAAVHAITYTAPFAFITWSPFALGLIFGSHFLIDRYRLARLVVWAKNRPWPDGELSDIHGTGYPVSAPPWLAVWLTIIADNTLHILCNGFAIWLAA
jgi:hypothetical protein